MLSRLRPAFLRLSQSRLHALAGLRSFPELEPAQLPQYAFDHERRIGRDDSQASALRPLMRVPSRTIFTSASSRASKPESEGGSSGGESQAEKRGQEAETPNPEAEAAENEGSSAAEAGESEDIKEKEIAALKERVLRAYADMENMRDRMLRENSQMKLFAIQGFARGLLDVADNLARAASSAAAVFEEGKEPASADAVKQHLKSLFEGVQATERQLLKVFKSHGLERFSPENEAFDPNRHEAMFQVEDPGKEPGTVIQVLKDGYLLHGRVLRAAEVGVTTKSE